MNDASGEIFYRCLEIVASATDVPSKIIMSRNRTAKVAFARHLLFYVLRRHFFFTEREVIARMNVICPGTIHNGLRNVENLYPNDNRRKLLRAIMDQLEAADTLSFDRLSGCAVVVQNRKTRKIHEAIVEKLTPVGDGVRLKIGELPGIWYSRREWLVLDRVTT